MQAPHGGGEIIVASAYDPCCRRRKSLYTQLVIYLAGRNDNDGNVDRVVFLLDYKNKRNFKYSLGLSATVNRKDGLSKVFKWFIGDIIYKVGKKKDVECEVDVAIFEDSNSAYCHEPVLFNGKVNMAKMINNVAEYETRMDFVINKLEEILEKEPTRNVIIKRSKKTFRRYEKE